MEIDFGDGEGEGEFEAKRGDYYWLSSAQFFGVCEINGSY